MLKTALIRSGNRKKSFLSVQLVGSSKAADKKTSPGEDGALVTFVKGMAAPFIRYGKALNQAKSAGGVLPRIRGPAVRLARDSYIRYGDCVGEDPRGNIIILLYRRVSTI